MNHFTRAIVIIRRVLDPNFDDWQYEFDGGLIFARLSRHKWYAELRSAYDDSVSHDLRSYLEACRSKSPFYKIDLWVDGEGLVFSARRSGGNISILVLRRGTWETLYFGLPSPKGKRSPYYCEISR